MAADLNGGPGEYRMPWLTSPQDWHPAETRFTASWPQRYLPEGRGYAGSLFASQILRRLPGQCPPPRAVFHDLWINRIHGTGCSIQFEWQNGSPRAAVLHRLLDQEFGPGAEIELLDGQTTEDCYSNPPQRVKVRSTREPGSEIILRHWTSDDAGMNPLVRKVGEAGRVRRAALEQQHGYRVTKRPVASATTGLRK